MSSTLALPRGLMRMGAAAALALVATIASVAVMLTAGNPAVPAGRVAAAHGGSAPAAGSAGLDPRIAALARRDQRAPVSTIVQFAASTSPAAARGAVKAVGGRVVGQVQLIRALVARLTPLQAEALAGRSGVHSVSLNARVHVSGGADGSAAGISGVDQLGNTFLGSLNVPALWQAGGTGAGVGVAVIDTGVQGDLPDFAAADGSSRVVATATTNPGAENDGDSFGHGTDVAGIIAANGANRDPSDPLRGSFTGVAPDASLISLKVADEQGNTNVLSVIYALQFAVDFQHRYNIRVVNLSLDEDTAQSYSTDPLDAAVEAAWRHGIVVVAAAGNRGSASDAVDYAPANDPYVITVGAVDEQGSTDVARHTIATWSSRGTTQDGFVKPDLYAPGAHIVSDLAPDSAFSSLCPSCIVDDQYIRASGTSFAAPMVSGLVADALELNPGWTPDQVKGALLDPRVQTSGSPEVDGLAVAQLPDPAPADQGLPRNRMIDASGGGIDYTRASWSRASWSRASWSRASWSRASWSRASWSRASWSRASWSLAAGTSSTGFARASWSLVSWSSLPG